MKISSLFRYLITLALAASAGIHASAERYYILPDYTIYSQPQYIGPIGKTSDTLEITPKRNVDGFVAFNFAGRTGYVSERSVHFEGDPASMILYANPGNAFWKKTITQGGNIFEVYYDESGQVAATHSGNLYSLYEDGKRVAGVTINSTEPGSRGSYHVLDEPQDPSVPTFLDGYTSTPAKDKSGNSIAFTTSRSGADAEITYEYRSQSAPDTAIYAFFAEQREAAATYAAENSDTTKNAVGKVGSLLMGIFALLLFAYMVAYVFAFNWLNDQWARLAGYDFTPRKRLNTMLLRGIIPVALLFVPLAFGADTAAEAKQFTSMRQFYEPSLLMLAGLGLSLLYMVFDAGVLSRGMSFRAAFCRSLYCTVTLGAVAILLVMMVYIAAIALGLLLLFGFFAAGGSSSSSGGGSGREHRSCSNCRYYNWQITGQCDLHMGGDADNCSKYTG